ncbi:hypothetical protein Chor_000019 [Crotalus horridus]
MDKNSPCGSGLGPGSSSATGGKGQQPRSNSAGPAGGESKPKGEGKNASGSRQRYNRKRETSYPKNETFPSQSRRSFPQKSKTFNKMPPQRGEQNSGGKSFSLSSNGGRRDEVAETQRAEFSPAQFSGPKKINLNHLLNFTFEPRGHTSHFDGSSHGPWGKRNRWENKPFNKELFLQANVVALETRQYAIGDTITMHLMQRKKGALIALPKSALAHVEQPVHLGDKPHSQYSKLLLASEGQVLQQVILEEKMALLHQYQEEKHTPEACFIEAALQELKDREGNLMCDSDVPGVAAAVEKLVVTEASKKETAALPQEKKCVLEYLSAFNDELLESPPVGPANGNPPALDSAEAAADNGMERNTDPASPSEAGEAILSAPASGKPKAAFASGHTQSPPSYYFYQAEDGQCLYLHPVNVRCLVHEYGSLEKSPEKITATVDVRQRHRYLCHLPLTCEFSICELALKSPVVSKETLQMFSDPEVRIALENLQQFPAFSAGSRELAESLLTPLSSSSLGSPPFLIGSLEEDSAFPSFAQPHFSEETPTGAPPAPGDSDAESDSSDRVPVPSFQNSFSKAIEAAFLKLDTPSTSDHLLDKLF